MKDLELYIHIPFCVQKCKYCDFLSAPAGRQVQNAYMEALVREIGGRGEELRQEEGMSVRGGIADWGGRRDAAEEACGSRVVSVFLGGGTPSVVEPRWIGRLMEAVRAHFFLAPDAEVTMELNPGTVTEEGLALYKKAGINRLSIGMQSADDAELKRLGRIHDHRQFLDTYHMARKLGFDNINVDLMAALPGQTREDHIRNLQAVLALEPAPEHISAYSLIVEEGTPFFDMAERGELDLPDEELERRMYWDTVRILQEAGYGHYEISNYARPGFECRHNCGYWLRTDYLGFGVGAASLLNNTRFLNSGILREYVDCPLECRAEPQRLSGKDIMEETMFLGLRMMEGVSEGRFRTQFGRGMEEVYGEVIVEGIRDGLLEWREADGPHGSMAAGVRPGGRESMAAGVRPGGSESMTAGARPGDRRLALTPRGIDLSNYIMAKFLLETDPAIPL